MDKNTKNAARNAKNTAKAEVAPKEATETEVVETQQEAGGTENAESTESTTAEANTTEVTEEPKADEAPLTFEQKLEAMLAKAVEKAGSTKGKKAEKSAKEPKEKPALIGAQRLEPFALPTAEELKGFDAMRRMNELLDCAEVLGFGDGLVSILEKHLQHAIQKELDIEFVQGVQVPNAVIRFWKLSEVDYKAFDAKAVVEVEAGKAMRQIEANRAAAKAREAEGTTPDGKAPATPAA